MSGRPNQAPPRPPEEGWFSRERALVLVLLAATALAVYVCCRLAEPFLPALAWALALAVVAHPLHTWLLRRLHRPSLAAGLAVGPVTLTITVALAEVWRRRTAGGRAAEAGVDE